MIIENKEQVIKDCKEELIEQNSHSKIDQIKDNERYEELRDRYDKATEKLSKIEDLKFEMRTKKHRAEEFIESLKQSSELLTEFDERTWYALIEKVIVNTDGSMNFEFKNGKIIK